MSDWPDEFLDPDEIKRLKQAQASPAPSDMPKAAKQGKPPKERVLPTWGVPMSGKGKPSKNWTAAPEYQPVDKAALRRQREDAEWAAAQQKEIARAGKRRARDAKAAVGNARKATRWQEAADREIAQANRGNGGPRGGASYFAEATAGGAPGGGCAPRGGCILAVLPTWLVLVILILLLAGIWASG